MRNRRFGRSRTGYSPGSLRLSENPSHSRPLSTETYDEFHIIVNVSAQGLDVEIPAQVADYCAPDRRGPKPVLNRPESILSSNKRSTCDLYKDLPSLTHSYAGLFVHTSAACVFRTNRAGASPPSRVYCSDSCRKCRPWPRPG